MPDEPVLRTKRLVLRRVVADDVENFTCLNAGPDVMRFLDWRPPTRQQVAREIDRILAGYREFPNHGRFVAENVAGAFLGWFGLTVSQAGSSAPDLGYRLRREVWGQGLATEGALALVDYAFTKLNAERITANAMFVNWASRRVMEKCGMSHVRTVLAHFDDPLPGTEYGEVVYEITRVDWLAAAGQCGTDNEA